MRSDRKRIRRHVGVLLALSMALAAAVPAQAPPVPPEFDIDAQDAAAALAEFSSQSELQLLFDFDAVQGLRTQAVTGRLRVADALGRMLTGTGLTFEIINARTISIV